MREILFKAQRADGKGWVKGTPYYIEKEGVCFIINNCQSLNLTSEYSLFLGIEVIRETVCQYTGLNDKNGTRIFEGDIDKERRVIIWNDKLNLHCLHRKNRDEYLVCYYPFTKRDAIDIEIIGNLHDKNEK